MALKKKYCILFFVLSLFFLAGFFLAFNYFQKREVSISLQKTAVQNLDNSKESQSNVAQKTSKSNFFVAGWLPYWQKELGASSLNGNLNLFSEIDIFAWGVNSDGSLKDTPQSQNSPWPKLEEDAKAKNVNIAPTILWGDALAMHKVFTDPTLLKNHIEAISNLLEQNDFSGVDIDYEGKDVADKDNFSAFLKALHEKLSANGKTLNCTVEARTQDNPPTGFVGTRAMSWANDYTALNDDCDSVRVMAYDQVFQVYRAKNFDIAGAVPYAPNADINWATDVTNYALKYISANKLILGIPTYGWEFLINKTPDGFEYSQLKSISYPDAIAEAKVNGVIPQRNVGGELDFTYRAANSNGQHLVDFSDAQAISQKIQLAQKLGIKGVSLFKIDGLSDPQLFSTLKSVQNN